MSAGPTTAAPPDGTTGGIEALPPGAPTESVADRRKSTSADRAAALTGAARSASGVVTAALSIDDVFEIWTANRTLLNTSITGRFIEPEGDGPRDGRGDAYRDTNYWNFCAPGAATVAAYYWRSSYVMDRGGQTYTEPYGPIQETTWWDAYDTTADTGNGYTARARGYQMYLAMKVNPPSFDEPGVVDFSVAGTKGANLQSVTEALNWELSGRNRATWKGYYYMYTLASNTTKSSFINAVRSSLFDLGSPVVVFLDTYDSSTERLPNWNRSVRHAITIVGYNNSNDTFTYTDTCGKACGSTTNGGTHTVSWDRVWERMRAWSGGGFIR